MPKAYMRPIHKWIAGCLFIIVLGTLSALAYGYRVLKSEVPPLNETINLPGLQKPVEVIVDKWGVPHVFGASDRDLVRVLGYLQARDRLWQMDLVRRAAAGRLSEIFGESQFETDAFQRVIGLERFAKNAIGNLDPETLAIMQAYSDGINAFIKEHPDLPTFEFRLIGYKMEPWKPADIIMLGRMTGWALSANWQDEILRYALIAERKAEQGLALLPRHTDPGPYIIPPEEKKYGQGASNMAPAPIRLATNDGVGAGPRACPYGPTGKHRGLPLLKLIEMNEKVRRNIGAVAGSEFASNSWVVSPQKSVSGGAMLSNDPHLELLLPSVWHEAHLVGDTLNVTGVAFPGTPFIVLGHTPKVAWGATTTVADTQDLYLLNVNKENEKEYMFNGKWEPFVIVDEKIRVRKKDSVEERTIKVRISRHGPVITDSLPDLPRDLPPLALRWTGYEPSNEIRALMRMAKSTSWLEFLDALTDLKIPIQNWVYADSNGNIGYIANGLLPIRPKSDGTLPVPGDDPSYEWQGFVPQDKLPQLTNPKSGYIATANNKVVPENDYPFVVSYRYAAPYRAMRITELLKAKDKLNIQDMSAIQMDNKLLLGQRLAKYFIEAYEKRGDKSNANLAKAIAILKNWDFFTPTSSIATLFFLESYRQAFKLTFEDEMSNVLFDSFREDRGAWNNFDNGIESDFEFFDDRRTPDVESRDDILQKAMLEAVNNLSRDMGQNVDLWKWGKRHTITFNHPFGQVETLKKLLSFGPYELAGARDTVNNGFFNWFVHPYVVWEGPSLRHIVDFGKMEDSRFTITVGQSGHRLSNHYSDQINDWISGNYHPTVLTREAAQKIAEGSIKFVPAP